MPKQAVGTQFSLRFTAAATIDSVDAAAQQVFGREESGFIDEGLGIVHPSDRAVLGALLKAARHQSGNDPASAATATAPAAGSDIVRFIGADNEPVFAAVACSNRLDTEGVLIVDCVIVSDPHATNAEILVNDHNDAMPPIKAVDPSLPNDIGILIRDNYVIDMATGPVQAKLGCHPDMLIGLDLWELISDDYVEAFRTHLHGIDPSATGTHSHFGELGFVAPDAQQLVVDAVVLVRPSGLVLRVREVDSAAGSVGADNAGADTAVVFIDDQMLVTYVSDSFPVVTKRAVTSSIGRQLLAVVHPTDHPYPGQPFEQPALDGEINGVVWILDDARTWGAFEVLGRNYLDDPTVGQVALHVTPANAETSPASQWNGRLGSFCTDAQGTVCFVNDRLAAVVGLPDDSSVEWNALHSVDEDGVSEIVPVEAEGQPTRFLQSRIHAVEAAAGEPAGSIGIVSDVTHFVMNGDLPESPRPDAGGSVIVLEQRVLGETGDDEIGATESVEVHFLSADLAQFVGYPELPCPLAEVFTPKSALALRSMAWPTLVADGSWAGELWLRSERGPATAFGAEFHGMVEQSAEGALVASGIITGIDRPPAELGADLGIDRQTLLLRGEPLKRRVERALARTAGGNATVALALIGLDTIDPVVPLSNATSTPFLTPADRALLESQIADRLTEICRHDEVTARISEQNYAVLSQRLGDQVDIELLTSRLAAALEPTFELFSPARSYELGFSVGVASSVDGPRSADELFVTADNALAAARAQGRTRIVVANQRPALDVDNSSSLEDEFRDALLSGAIDNVYQPIIGRDSSDEEPVRYEALVRWNDPRGVVRGAQEVLEVADRLELASAVGHRVADRALEFVSTEQHRSGRELEMRINLSRAQLQERGFVSRLDALLRLYEVAPEQLGVELSETIVAGLVPETERLFAQLDQIGVAIVVDDVVGRLFAAGARASVILGYVSGMKLDRRLVEGVGRNASDTSQVAGLLARAREHHIEVTAVGVATGRQSTLLSDLGCDWLQGFLIARPTTGAALVARSSGAGSSSSGSGAESESGAA